MEVVRCVFIVNNGDTVEYVMVVRSVNTTLERLYVDCVVVVLSAHIRKKEDNALIVTVA